MNKLVIFLFCVVYAPCLLAQTNKADSAEELLAIERKRSEAIAAHDTAYLAALYADDFRGVTATGYEVNKEKLLAVFALDNPGIRFDLDNMEARLFDDMAIVTGRLMGKSAENGAILHNSLYIHVYQKRNGSWQIVAGQGTMIQKP